MTITVLDVPVSDDPATAIFDVWFSTSGLEIPRETALMIFEAGVNTGRSANFRSTAPALRVYEQPKLQHESRLLLTA